MEECLEDMVHEGLESCRFIDEAKRHHLKFKGALVCFKGCFMNVLLPYPYLVQV